MKTLGFQGFHWRRGWDSNPCAIARKLISSQPRYDHFDTSPYMLTRHTEINAIFSCIRIPVRTLCDAVIGRCPKTARLKAFWKIDFRLAKKISSQPRYDHFDTSPSMLNPVLEYNDYSIFHRTGRPAFVRLRCPKKSAHPWVFDFFDRCTQISSLHPPQAALRRFDHFDTSPFCFVVAAWILYHYSAAKATVFLKLLLGSKFTRRPRLLLLLRWAWT